MEQQSPHILELKGVTKYYPGVTALDNVDFELRKGEIHVLVGENGAGKSTLVKVIVGDKQPEKIEAFKVDGKAVQLIRPKDSLRLGIAAVQQHFALAPDMSVAENIFLGSERYGGLMLDDRGMNEAARELVEQLGVSLNPTEDVRFLSPGDRQVVEICRALSLDPKILLMDEPTSGLNQEEIRRLFEILKKLKSRGVSIIYISHRLQEVFEIGDRVTVLRNGEKVFTGAMDEVNHEKLAELIVGRDIKDKYPKREVGYGELLLEVERLENRHGVVPLQDISFALKAGEILGVYGILGSGKDELARTLAGVEPATGGTVRIKGREVHLNSPKQAINHGVGYLTDDRHGSGLVLTMSVKKNQTLPGLRRFTRFNHVVTRLENEISDLFINKLRIRTPSRDFGVNDLSGGNQQKVVLSKWLIAESDVLILHEPTRGIDVGSKVEVFELMMEQAEEGRCVLFVTSELDEAAEIADRILVMRDGQIVKEFRRHEVSQSELLRVATESAGRRESPATEPVHHA